MPCHRKGARQQIVALEGFAKTDQRGENNLAINAVMVSNRIVDVSTVRKTMRSEFDAQGLFLIQSDDVQCSAGVQPNLHYRHEEKRFFESANSQDKQNTAGNPITFWVKGGLVRLSHSNNSNGCMGRAFEPVVRRNPTRALVASGPLFRSMAE